MHSTLAELLENLKPGLLWVSRDGLVRYANGDAGVRTGLAPSLPRDDAPAHVSGSRRLRGTQ